MKQKIAVFDIDMTIINSSWVWRYLDECGSFSAVYDTYGDHDKPINTTINIIQQLHEEDILPVFLTARPLSDYDKTLQSLKKHLPFIKDYSLFMVGYEEGIDGRKYSVLEDLNEQFDIMFFMDDCPHNRLAVSDLNIVALDIIRG